MTLLCDLIDYSKKVISNEIVSCQKHKWACQRFLKDLEKSGTEEFPYVFNEEKAERFFAWMRMFKHRQGLPRLIGKNIDPHIIQKFIFGNIYGWYHKDTGYRRFKKMYWQVGRKNAKSQSLAVMGLYELMVFTQGRTEVYIGATKTDQAKIIWDEASAMVKGCEFLNNPSKRYNIAYSKIIHIKTDSIMRALSEEDGETGDGLNVQCGMVDEYHAHKTAKILNILVTAGGARPESIIPIITTAGENLNNPCYRSEYQLCSKILDPDVDINIESYFVMINELDSNNKPDPIGVNGRIVPPGELVDDITDENVWVKANPIQCSYPEGRDFVRCELQAAIADPEKMTNVLTKIFNVWVNKQTASYMDMAKWAACGCNEKRLMPDIYGKKVFPGVDLSAIHDLTSVTFEIPMTNDEYAILSHSFVPGDVIQQKQRSDKVPYDLWIRQGWITVIPGQVVEYHAVIDYILDQFKKYGWKKDELCYDRAMAAWFAQEVESKRVGFKAVDIPQSYVGTSEAVKDLKAKIYAKKIYHDNNPVLGWAFSNCVTRKGPTENVMLDKGKSTNRIDPVAAAVNAHCRAMVKEVKAGGRVFII